MVEEEKEMKKTDKKELILKAALNVFSRKSFHQVKVEEIAALAGVGKGTIYDYFESKEEIFEDSFKVSSESYMKIFDSCLEEDIPFWKKVKFIIKFHIRFLKNHEEMARFVLDTHSRSQEELKEWVVEKRNQRLEVVKRMIQKGIEEGEIREVDVEIASRVFLGLVFSVCSGMLFFDGMLPGDDTQEKLLDLFYHGLGT